MIAVIELKEELYVVTIVGDYRPEVRTYYTQRGIRSFMRGRALDLIVLKNVELTERTREEITPCLIPTNGKFMVIGEEDQKLKAIRTLNNALYEALPSGKVDAFELIKLIGSHYEQVAEVLDK